MSKINKNSVIFTLDNAEKLGAKVSEILVAKGANVQIGKTESHKFSNGEIMVKSKTSVRAKGVFIIQSTSKPVNESLMELLIFVDALKRASAKFITVVVPYLAYARQDRKAAGREPITAKLIADILQAAGVDRVMTFDLHAPQVQGFFNIPVDDLKAIFLLEKIIGKKINSDNVSIVSPDHGGVKRARSLAQIMGADLAILDKRRPKHNESVVTNILGNVEGKDCILIDDMIDTGGTISASAKLLREKGARTVTVACTHGIFSGDAVQNLNDGGFDNIFTTDTIEDEETRSKINNLTIVSIAPFLANVIESTINHRPVSDIYKDLSQTQEINIEDLHFALEKE